MTNDSFRAAASIVVVLAAACKSTTVEHPADSVLREAVERGDAAGVVAMAATPDGVVYEGAFGNRTSAYEMTEDTIVRIASMTKAVTSVAAMQLVEEGAVELDEPVSAYISDFDPQVLEGFDTNGEPMLRPPASPVTARHLLTHTAGFGYEVWNASLHDGVRREIFPSVTSGGDAFLGAPLVFDPGSAWHYGINTDWLGRVIETVRGETLEDVFRERIFEPLGMNDTHFNLPAEKRERLAAVYERKGAELAEQDQGVLPIRTFYSGGGGLVSTARDYMRFLRMLLNGGSFEGARILEAETVELMAANQIGELEAGAMKTVMPPLSNDFDFFPGSSDRFGLGFLLNSEIVTGGRAAESLAWAGLYNTYFWVDRDRGVAGVLMVQILPFFDARTLDLLESFERSIYATLPTT